MQKTYFYKENVLFILVQYSVCINEIIYMWELLTDSNLMNVKCLFKKNGNSSDFQFLVLSYIS